MLLLMIAAAAAAAGKVCHLNQGSLLCEWLGSSDVQNYAHVVHKFHQKVHSFKIILKIGYLRASLSLAYE